MIVRQQVERHGGDFRQQLVERRRVGGRGDVITVPAPHRRFLVPGGGYRENHRLGHLGSVAALATPSRLPAASLLSRSHACVEAADYAGRTRLTDSPFAHDEGAQLRFEFKAELARLEAA